MSRLTLIRRACRNVLLSGLVLLAAACGSSGSAAGSPASAGSPSSSAAAPPASGSAALCSEVAALRGSLHQLASIRPSPSTVAELRTAVQDVQSNLAGLSSAAGNLWSGQVSDLKSFTQLTVRSIDGRPLPLQADGDYLGEVQEARYSILPRALNVIA